MTSALQPVVVSALPIIYVFIHLKTGGLVVVDAASFVSTVPIGTVQLSTSRVARTFLKCVSSPVEIRFGFRFIF
jgi:hypothetical protein